MRNPKDESSEDVRKEELRKKLEEAKDAGETLASFGRDLTKDGQFGADLADAMIDDVSDIDDHADWEGLIDSWDVWNERAQGSIKLLKSIGPLISSTTSGSAFSSSGIISEGNFLKFTAGNQTVAREAFKHTYHVISRYSKKEEVLALMKEFGLNQAPKGRKSPAEQFITAYEAFEKPVTDSDPVATSLMPIRQSIQATIDELFRLKPKQKPAKNQWEKVVSIGTQLKRDNLNENDVKAWAGQWETLKDELSEAKEAEFDRKEWVLRLQRATFFLDSLLNGLDPSKLRK